jgi:hypothetical protein
VARAIGATAFTCRTVRQTGTAEVSVDAHSIAALLGFDGAAGVVAGAGIAGEVRGIAAQVERFMALAAGTTNAATAIERVGTTHRIHAGLFAVERVRRGAMRRLCGADARGGRTSEGGAAEQSFEHRPAGDARGEEAGQYIEALVVQKPSLLARQPSPSTPA